MSKKIILYSLLFVFSVICGIAAGIMYVENKSESIAMAEHTVLQSEFEIPEEEFQQKEITVEEIEIPSATPVYESEKYVVTLSDTKILIYKISSDGSMQTIEEKPISMGSIPREDYNKLYSGIVVESLESAIELVEDYIS